MVSQRSKRIPLLHIGEDNSRTGHNWVKQLWIVFSDSYLRDCFLCDRTFHVSIPVERPFSFQPKIGSHWTRRWEWNSVKLGRIFSSNINTCIISITGYRDYKQEIFYNYMYNTIFQQKMFYSNSWGGTLMDKVPGSPLTTHFFVFLVSKDPLSSHLYCIRSTFVILISPHWRHGT